MAQIRYFLGANSPSGFYSLYDQLIDLETARSVYLLKGGPGCGKSSLMRRVARHAEAAGCAVEYIICSGDPDSLDAIVIPELSAALVDATAPHVRGAKRHFLWDKQSENRRNRSVKKRHIQRSHKNRAGTMEQAKGLPCPFNNRAVFYDGKFQTVNQIDAAAVERMLKK